MMTPSADGIECITFAGDEFSQVSSRTISESLASLSCFAEMLKQLHILGKKGAP